MSEAPTTDVLRSRVAELAAELAAIEQRSFEALRGGAATMSNGDRAAAIAAGEALLAELERLAECDRAAASEFEDAKGRAEAAVALGGGPAVCRVTQQPLAMLTDYGNAERIAKQHADRLRYAPGEGWLAWDGRRWRRDDDGAAMRCAKRTARSIREEAREINDDKLAEAVFKHAVRSEQASRLEAALRLAQSEEELLVAAANLDAEPYLFNCLSGTIDLRTGELREHDPADLLTHLAPVEFGREAEAPTWDAFLGRVLPDPALRAWLQRFAGYLLTGDTSEQILALIHGSGANGKTVSVETLGAMLGDYAATADASTFVANQGAGIPADLARLRGKRFVRTSETEQGAQLARELVKRVTGGDEVTARHLYQAFFSYHPSFKLAIVTNNLPRIPHDDRATWRRIRLVPFTETIPHGEQDRHLLAKLRKELPGVLRWAVEGCLRWQAEGLGVPESVAEATHAYRAAEDTVQRFLDERCFAVEEGGVPPKVLADAYFAFCRDEGLVPVTRRVFPRHLRDKGFEQDHTRQARLWTGIGVRP